MKHALHTLVGTAILLAAMGCKDKSSTPSAAEVAPDAKKAVAAQPAIEPSKTAVKVEFFVMSQCPYGVRVVDAVTPVLKKLGSEADFHLEFIGSKKADGTLESMHGPKEVTGDKAQLCAAEISRANYLDFVACQNKDYRNVATNWESCAKKSNIDVQKLTTCIEGAQGNELLAASFDRARAKGARGSPTMYIGNKLYSGQRTANAFLRAICNAHSDAKAVPACAELPEQKPVNVTIVSDKRCGDECQRNAARAKGQLSNIIGKPVFTEVDYADEAGKALYDKVAGKRLPLVVVDQSIDGDPEAIQALRRGLQPTKDPAYRMINFGSTWDPICMNEGGCQIEQCKHTMACRPETPGKLELFVMSQCPYGVKALDAMAEVLKNFDNKLDFEVHFIASGTAKGGFRALHGQPEVDENIRELCAIKHYGVDYKFMDYVLCRNKNIRSADWEPCTGKNGIDTAVIKACFEGDEGKQLLEQDIKIAEALNISGSPSWIVNGKHKFSGLDAETIRAKVCNHNASLKGCENTLSKDTGAPVQGGCGN